MLRVIRICGPKGPSVEGIVNSDFPTDTRLAGPTSSHVDLVGDRHGGFSPETRSVLAVRQSVTSVVTVRGLSKTIGSGTLAVSVRLRRRLMPVVERHPGSCAQAAKRQVGKRARC